MPTTYIDLDYDTVIRIGPDVRLTLSRAVEGYRAVLGVEAPREVRVDRSEVVQERERRARKGVRWVESGLLGTEMRVVAFQISGGAL